VAEQRALAAEHRVVAAEAEELVVGVVGNRDFVEYLLDEIWKRRGVKCGKRS
jgi:hypothetical protein